MTPHRLLYLLTLTTGCTAATPMVTSDDTDDDMVITTPSDSEQTNDTDDTVVSDTDGATVDSDVPAAHCAGKASGTAIGECAPNFTLLDQLGVAHSLYDHAGDVIVLDFSTMWCPHCQNLADDLETVHQTYGSQGVTVITVLHENQTSQPPTAENLQTWIDAFDVTHTVLTDPDASVEAVFGGFYQPNVLILDRDLEVVWRMTGSAAASAIGDAVEDAL